jgi:hypothetical protein
MYFDLITWPGYLCYTGDMGTYVFCRLNDMFEFFRTDREHMRLEDGETLAINPSYWGEKLQAIDRGDGYRRYSHEKFIRIVNERVEQYIEDEELNDEQAQELRDAVESEVLDCDESEDVAHRAARDFEHEGFEFSDFWEYDLKDYTFRFMWCCYAIAWGVKKYDDAKQVSGIAA